MKTSLLSWLHLGSRLTQRNFLVLAGVGLLTAPYASASAQTLVRGRASAVLESSDVRVVADLAGGSIGEFSWRSETLNPLQWNAPAANDTRIRGFGHFLCLDRWGPPSKAEGANGMPYHGEAASVAWTLEKTPETLAGSGSIEAVMSARLPLAGLGIRRTLTLSSRAPVCRVTEEITNQNRLGRILNAVQHPTLAPPFLEAETVVDCNGSRGFAQGEPRKNPESPSTIWPNALDSKGRTVDLRRLTDDPNPNVVSYAIEGEWGWVTAVHPGNRRLIGYLWRTQDYPWVSLWRDVRDGKPAARGLEFGTTGLHQPFPILVEQGRIWNLPLFFHLDAGESRTLTYWMFLARVPEDFQGVGALRVEGTEVKMIERRKDAPRELSVSLENLRR